MSQAGEGLRSSRSRGLLAVGPTLVLPLDGCDGIPAEAMY